MASETGIVKYKSGHGEVTISPDIIIRYLAPNAQPEEAYLFLELCRAQGLNPFLREAYLIVYGSGENRTVSMVVGKDTFTQRADSHPQYGGKRSGVIVQVGEDITQLEGAFYPDTAKLAGGWAEVHRKDREIPVTKKVRLAEFTTGRSSWNKMPGTMIEKVALVQALREAFPSSFVGLYDTAEMGEEIAEVQTKVLPTPDRGQPMAPPTTLEEPPEPDAEPNPDDDDAPTPEPRAPERPDPSAIVVPEVVSATWLAQGRDAMGWTNADIQRWLGMGVKPWCEATKPPRTYRELWLALVKACLEERESPAEGLFPNETNT